MVIVCPLRPRCARPPHPKGEARDVRTVHQKVYRSAPLDLLDKPQLEFIAPTNGGFTFLKHLCAAGIF